MKKRGKRPGFFARLHTYRKEAELEWNNAWIWIERRKDGMYIVSTPKGLKDSKILLQFKIVNDGYDISVFNFDESDINNYKNALKKLLVVSRDS